MSTLRRTAATAPRVDGRLCGRPGAFLRHACLDVPNDLHSNGESLLQRWVLNMSSPGLAIYVIDVSANVGRWSAAMLAAALETERSDDLDLHIFEPSAYTFERLAGTLQGKNVSLDN